LLAVEQIASYKKLASISVIENRGLTFLENPSFALTKSVSRFARNTLDCLQYIRLLKENNIAVTLKRKILIPWMQKERSSL
jgi:hypothetical protein